MSAHPPASGSFIVRFDCPAEERREEVTCSVTGRFAGTSVASEFGQLDGSSLGPHSWAHISFLGVSLASPFNMHLQQTLKGRIKFISPSVSLLRDFTRANEVHEKLLEPVFSHTFLCMKWNWKGLNCKGKGKFFCKLLFAV